MYYSKVLVSCCFIKKSLTLLNRTLFLSIGLEGDERCHAKRNIIIEKVFQLSNENDIETKTANDLIGFLIIEVKLFTLFCKMKYEANYHS